jgi:hypothetical protein
MSTTFADARGTLTTTESDQIGIYTASFGISLGLTSVFNALLVVIKETNEHTVLAWMKAVGHHWVTHGALDVAVFVILGFALAQFGQNWSSSPSKVTALVVGGVVAGGLIVTGFFLRQLV